MINMITFLSGVFITLYKVFLPFESVNEMLKCDHLNENYWAVLSCGAVYYVVLDCSKLFEPVDELLNCDDSNERYSAVFSCGAIYYAI